jgi:hypothetical protein
MTLRAYSAPIGWYSAARAQTNRNETRVVKSLCERARFCSVKRSDTLRATVASQTTGATRASHRVYNPTPVLLQGFFSLTCNSQ